MNHRLVFTHSYTKRAGRFARQHPELLGQYEKVLRILELNPFHPALRLHKLRGRLNRLHAVSINIRYRIVLILEFGEHVITPVHIGTHDEVYRK